MEKNTHNMSNLFAQLGEPNDDVAIAKFIEAHKPLPGDMQLHEATFWSSAQAKFLREAICDDADWAAVTDNLNARLHDRH